MAYPVKAKYPGEDRAKTLCRDAGGAVEKAKNNLRVRAVADQKLQEAGVKGWGPQSTDMTKAQQISDAVPRRKE